VNYSTGLLLTDPDTEVCYHGRAELCSVTVTVLTHYSINEKT